MEKSYYLVTQKQPLNEPAGGQSGEDFEVGRRSVVAITQGGFGQDVIDDERQAKERFLEHLFFAGGIDLPRSPETFDSYFTLEPVDELIDLDEEN